jgi:hypothetical protein
MMTINRHDASKSSDEVTLGVALGHLGGEDRCMTIDQVKNQRVIGRFDVANDCNTRAVSSI